MWPEVQQAEQEKRYELVLVGEEVEERVKKKGLDDSGVYTLSQLNFLRVSKTSLATVSEEVGRLLNLTTLILQGNALHTLPASLGALEKLKVLDVSMNALQNLPEGVGQLANLTTLNASTNKLTSLPSFAKCVNLSVIDAGENCIREFPDICYEALTHLMEVRLANNEVTDVPLELPILPSLKLLDLCNNKVKVIPGEIVDCLKLKDLQLKGNALNDRRLRKLVESDRCLPRQVLDYVKQHCPKLSEEGKAGSGSGKGRKGKMKKGKGRDSEEVDELCNEMHVLGVTEGVPVVQVDPSVKEVRPYIVCCILQDMDLSGENLKKFITAQTKLHEGICEKRLAATIATHDLAKMTGPLTFTARPPEDIVILPLLKTKEVTARQLYDGLQHDAEKQRKNQKRNNVSGIHKFLHLVDKWSVWPCLVDASQKVISLPPITNAETTKISQSTTAVFVEVTSSTSLGKAKEVLDALVLSCLHSCISQAQGDQACIKLQQVRVEEGDGSLRVLYPSRTDLVFQQERVRVVMPESK